MHVILFGANSATLTDFVAAPINNNFISISRKRPNLLMHHYCVELSRTIPSEEVDNIVTYLLQFDTEFIFILSAWCGTMRSTVGQYTSLYGKSNQTIIDNVLQICKKVIPLQVIFFSSAGALYPFNSPLAWNESHPVCLNSSYAIQKYFAEIKLAKVCTKYDIKLCIMRISCCYGFNSLNPAQGIINHWIYSLLCKKPIYLLVDLDSVLNFISYSQFSKCLREAITEQLFGIYNIGTSESVSLRIIYEQISVFFPLIASSIVESSSIKRINYLDVTKFFDKTSVLLSSSVRDDVASIYEAARRHLGLS